MIKNDWSQFHIKALQFIETILSPANNLHKVSSMKRQGFNKGALVYICNERPQKELDLTSSLVVLLLLWLFFYLPDKIHQSLPHCFKYLQVSSYLFLYRAGKNKSLSASE